jgi:hypothetical protein
MNFHIRHRNEKVAVHCHAGYGRTGIVCACWFIYSLGLGAQEAIDAVRSRRPGSVQTKKQKAFVIAFEAHLRAIRCVYVLHNTPSFIPSVDPTISTHDIIASTTSNSPSTLSVGSVIAETPFSYTQPLTLELALSRQRTYLSGHDARIYKNVPKVVAWLCDKLTSYASSTNSPLLQLPSRSHTGALSLSPAPSLPILPPLVDHIPSPVIPHTTTITSSTTLPSISVAALPVTSIPIAATPIHLPLLPPSALSVAGAGTGATTAVATSTGSHTPVRSATHRYSTSLSLSAPVVASLHAETPVPLTSSSSLVTPTVTITSTTSNLLSQSATTLVATSLVDVHPWDHTSEDALTRIKRRLNNDDWVEVERSDVRLLSMLLLDWIDTLATPILPSLVTTTLLAEATPSDIATIDVVSVARRAVVMSHENMPNRAVPTLNAIMILLQSLSSVDTPLLSRVYGRVSFALLQPSLTSSPPFRTLRYPDSILSTPARLDVALSGLESKAGKQADEKEEKQSHAATKPSSRKPAGARILPISDGKASTPSKGNGSGDGARSRIVSSKRLAPLSTSKSFVFCSNTDLALERLTVFMRLFVDAWPDYYASWLRDQRKRRIGVLTVDTNSPTTLAEPTADTKELKSIAAAAAIVAAASAVGSNGTAGGASSSPNMLGTPVGHRPILTVITTPALMDAPSPSPALAAGRTVAPTLISAPNSSVGGESILTDIERSKQITSLFGVMSLAAQETLLAQLTIAVATERMRHGGTTTTITHNIGELELPPTPVSHGLAPAGFNFGIVNATAAAAATGAAATTISSSPSGFGTPVSRSRPTSAQMRTSSPSLAVSNALRPATATGPPPLSPVGIARGLAPVRNARASPSPSPIPNNNGSSTPTGSDRRLASPPPRNSSFIRNNNNNNNNNSNYNNNGGSDIDGARSNSGTPPLMSRNEREQQQQRNGASERDHSPASNHQRDNAAAYPLPPVIVGDRRPSRTLAAPPIPMDPRAVALAAAARRKKMDSDITDD